MRWIVLGLVLSMGACTATLEMSGRDAGDAATGDSNSGNDGAPAPDQMADFEPGSAALTAPTFRVTNRANETRTEWVKVSIPYPPGVAPTVADLQHVTAEGQPSEMVALKWHYDPTTGARDSVAIAQLRTRLTLSPGEDRTVTLSEAVNALAPFALGSGVDAWLQGTPAADAVLSVRIDGDPQPYTVSLFPSTKKVIEQGKTSETWRYRGHFSRNGTDHALSVTTYLTLDHEQDHGELVILVGNDTVQMPVGNLHIDELRLTVKAPLRFQIRERGAYGISPPVESAGQREWVLLSNIDLGDGQQWPVRGRWAVTADVNDSVGKSFVAATDFPLYALADFASWRDSGSAGPLGYLPDPRFPDLNAGRQALQSGCTDSLQAGPVDHLGEINKNPPNTGDQPDFACNVSNFYVQAVQTGSPCALRKAAVAIDREALRPTFFWDQKGGTEDRAVGADYPDLFFWSGRPHWHASWNPEYPVWNQRSGGFQAGNTHGWGAMDNQHYGHNSLRGLWELTGDPYLKDLLVYHQSVTYWNFFTKYKDSVDAERAARLMKEAVLLHAVQDDTATAALLKQGVIDKNKGAYRDTVDSFINQYGIAALASVKDDARVALTQVHPGKDVGIGWQTGFHMEFQALVIRHGWDPTTAENIIDDYLDNVDVYFAANGDPVTYFLFEDPSQREFGGIGVTWWGGWIVAAAARAQHPNAAVVSNQVAGKLRPSFTSGSGFWSHNDRWQCFQ